MTVFKNEHINRDRENINCYGGDEQPSHYINSCQTTRNSSYKFLILN